MGLNWAINLEHAAQHAQRQTPYSYPLQEFISLRKFPQLALCTLFSYFTSAPGGQETRKCVLSNFCIAPWEQQGRNHRHSVLQPGWLMFSSVFFSWKGMQHTIGGDATLALIVLSPQFGVFPRGPAESSEGFLSNRRTWTSTAALDSLPLIPLGLLQTSQEIS